MTTLAITPNWKNKTAKFKGTVAAGEHVAVTIVNVNEDGNEYVQSATNLRLRVVDPACGRTLAIFPEPETSETWDNDLSPLRCTLNLNTVQMLKAVPPAANVPLLFVLDAYREDDAETEAYEGEFTLYFKDLCEVTHWPRRLGEEEPAPTDLDDYANIIADFNTRLTAAEETVAAAAQNAQSAAALASAAASSASTAATAATDAQTGAIAAKDAAQSAADDAATAKTAAETAQGKAEDAQEAAETAQGKAEEAAKAAAESAATFVVDDTLSVEGAAADAKAVGDANQDLITRIETVQDNLDNEVAAREELDGAVQVDRQNLANEIARAQGAEQALAANKADKDTTYTKSEVDAKVAGVQTFQKYLVQTLPDPDEADMKGLYLVPTGETSEEGDLCEEWTVVEEDGEKRWELIGGTTVDISSKQDKLYVVYPGDWTVSAYQHNEQIDAFVDAAVDVDVTITQQVPAQFLYVLTGYDEESYYVTPVVSTARTDNILFGVYDSSATTLYGYIRATLVESRQDVPAEVLSQVVPTGDSLVKSSGIWSAIWGALSALPTGFSSLYDWVVAQLAGKASTADATLMDASEWNILHTPLTAEQKAAFYAESEFAASSDYKVKIEEFSGVSYLYVGGYIAATVVISGDGLKATFGSSQSQEAATIWGPNGTTVATRTALQGYQLGSQTDKPLASEAEAEALRAAMNDKMYKIESVGRTGTFLSVDEGGFAEESGYGPWDFSSNWVSGLNYKQYDVVRYDGSFYYAKSDINNSSTAPSSDTTHWGSLANLAALAHQFLPLTGGTMTGPLILPFGIFRPDPFTSGGYLQFGYDAASNGLCSEGYIANGGGLVIRWPNVVDGGTFTFALAAPNPTAGNLAALDASGNPTDSGVKPSDKLDSTSAAPAFSTDSTYAVGDHVTYNGKLYRCTTAVTTAGAWDASKWTADTMTDPDAVLDITAQNQLRVVAKDGTLLWAQGYDLASTSSATLACDATNNFTFADGATTQAFALPTAPTGKVGDFGLDIDNSANTSAATMTLTGLDTTFSVVVPKGESLTDMLAIAAGELARFYITLTTFRVNNLPTWHIVKQVVENGGATT